ncbi:MAG TPA: acetyl-CoA carboxylase biotin carboxyl carrier protein subunit [Pyrinomonadaceae bacterium]|nr:acetyl-CoA carboxylase biotin carboxyl carrier protein subunit [Pyrinomonadaceae bacterium]
MKLKAIIDDQEHELNVKIDGSQVKADVDGRVYDLELREPEPGSYLFLRDAAVHECRVSKGGKGHDSFDVSLHGRNYAVTIVDPKRLRSGQDAHGHHHGLAEITAPMPGKVVRVQIEAGAAVEKGSGLVVVEAMKMQNEMKSPRAGVVVSINVKPGDTVNAGDVLAVVE